jgi:hypothetical protein
LKYVEGLTGLTSDWVEAMAGRESEEKGDLRTGQFHAIPMVYKKRP